MKERASQGTRGFSLLEVTIVIAILGLLAAVAIPRFAAHRGESRTATMVANLSILRSAIDSYWAQHDSWPGPTAAAFAAGLLTRTSAPGAPATGADGSCGPYLRMGALPPNPYTESSTVRMVARMPGQPCGSEAWIFCTTTGEVRSNVDGDAPGGKALFDL